MKRRLGAGGCTWDVLPFVALVLCSSRIGCMCVCKTTTVLPHLLQATLEFLHRQTGCIIAPALRGFGGLTLVLGDGAPLDLDEEGSLEGSIGIWSKWVSGGG